MAQLLQSNNHLFWVKNMERSLMSYVETHKKPDDGDCPPMTKPVVLQGIHLSIHVPTEERLTVQIEGLTPKPFRDLAVALEDWMVTVDDEYKKKATRGRGWKGRGKRITAETRVRVLKFSPFPSSFGNVLRTVRKNLYVTVHKHCLVLEGHQQGGYKHNIYILPYGNAPAFMNDLEVENTSIDDLNEKVAEFQKTSAFGEVKQILRRFGVDIVLARKTWNIEHATFDATPLALEPATVKQTVEEEYQRMFKTLEEHEKRGLEALQEELERKRKQLVIKGIENLKRKITNICTRITAHSKKNPKKVKADLERLRRIAVSVGLESIATTVIDPLREVIDDPEKAVKLFGTKAISTAIDSRIANLIDSI